MDGTHVIDHGSTRTGGWLRERRLRFTLWIAAFEGLLYLFHALHWWAAVGLAVIAVGFWYADFDQTTDDQVRDLLAAANSRASSAPLSSAALTR